MQAHERLAGADRVAVLDEPLDDRAAERANPDIAGRPQLVKGNRQLLFGGMGRLTEGSVVNIKNKSHSVTAEVDVPASGAEGVIVAERVREAFEASGIVSEQGPVDTTVSIGVAARLPGDAEGADIDRLLVAADRALYAAKAQGRDRVVRADTLA